MNPGIHFHAMFADPHLSPARRLVLFALVNLGVIDSLAAGVLSATDALKGFFHAENCVFVRKHLRDKTADQIMSHGVQLPDLFDILPADEANREFHHELTKMRSLCIKLVERQPLAA